MCRILKFIVFASCCFLTQSAPGQVNFNLNAYQVADIMPGAGSSTYMDIPVPFRNGVFFSADDGIHGMEPWFSDGTASGTFMLADIDPGSGSGYGGGESKIVNNRLLFSVYTAATGSELWVTDGTPGGTQMLPEVAPGATAGEGFEGFIASWNNLVFYKGTTIATGREMYCTDGTPGGTIFLGDVTAGTNSSMLDLGNTEFISTSNCLFYTGLNSASYRTMYATNGTPGGTFHLPLFAGSPSASQEPIFLTVLNNYMYFQGYSLNNGSELWRSDGTPAGTTLYHEFIPGANPAPSNIFLYAFTDQFTNARGLFYDHGNYVSLYKLDGAPGGLTWLHNMNDVMRENGWQVPSVFFSGSIYFNASDSLQQYGGELWKTSLAPGGTAMVKDIHPGTVSCPMDFIGVVNNRVLFQAETAAYGMELWRSNGTALTTALVKDITSGSANILIFDDQQIKFGPNKFVFTHEFGFLDPWITDGTTNGTFKLKNSTFNFKAEHYCQSDGNLFFTGRQGTNDQEVYVTNGTLASTRLVKDVNPSGLSNETTKGFVSSGGRVFYFFESASSGKELWAIRTSYRQNPTVVLREEISQNEDADLTLYPNPATDLIKLRFDELSAASTEIRLEVTDITGKVVLMNEKVPSNGDTIHEIEISSLQSGFYLVRMTSPELTTSVKFLKE